MLLLITTVLALTADTFTYTIRPAGPEAVDVALEFNAGARSRTVLRLPVEWDGESELFRHLTILRLEGAQGRVSDDSSRMVVTHAVDTKVRIVFRVRGHTGPIRGTSFNRPQIRQGSVFLLTNTSLLVPDFPDEQQILLRIRWRGFSQSAVTNTSYGAGRDQTVATSVGSWRKALLAAGALATAYVRNGRDSIAVVSFGRSAVADSTWQRSLGSILEHTAELWGGVSAPLRLVVLFATDDPPGNFGGEARTNSFATYYSGRTESLTHVAHTLAHELFHSWNPGLLGGVADERLYWFTEGVTDYYAARLMLQTRQWALSDFVHAYNRVAQSYYTSPARSLTADEMVQERRSSSIAQRLPYEQGFLLAANWDAEARQLPGARTLDHGLRELLRRVSAGVKLSNELIRESLDAGSGINIAEDIRGIQRGELVVPDSSLTSMLCSSMGYARAVQFDAGFDLEASFQTRIIAGVDPHGPAYRAGLRDGQRLIAGGMTRDPSERAEITVEDAQGRKTVQYFPRGPEYIIPDLRLRSSADSGHSPCVFVWSSQR